MNVLKEIQTSNCRYKGHFEWEEAIKYALLNVKFKDILLLAGKGHEIYTIIKDRVIPFDEKNIVLDILNDLEKK